MLECGLIEAATLMLENMINYSVRYRETLFTIQNNQNCGKIYSQLVDLTGGVTLSYQKRSENIFV